MKKVLLFVSGLLPSLAVSFLLSGGVKSGRHATSLSVASKDVEANFPISTKAALIEKAKNLMKILPRASALGRILQLAGRIELVPFLLQRQSPVFTLRIVPFIGTRSMLDAE
jgi:hypothetical protein